MDFRNTTRRPSKGDLDHDANYRHQTSTPTTVNTTGIDTDTDTTTTTATNTSSSSKNSRMSSPDKGEKATKEYVLAHQHEENFYHGGRGAYYRGLPPLSYKNLKVAVYGPGAEQWRKDAAAYQQSVKDAAANSDASPAPPPSRKASKRPSRAASASQQPTTSSPVGTGNMPTGTWDDYVARRKSSPIPAGRTRIQRITPPSPKHDSQEKLDLANFRAPDGSRVPPTKDSSSPPLRSLSNSPELPGDLAARLANTAADPSVLPTSTANIPADAPTGRGRSDRIRNLEAQRAAAEAANPQPRRIAQPRKRRAPRPASPEGPIQRYDDDLQPYDSRKHPMMVSRSAYDSAVRASTNPLQPPRADPGYAISYRNQPDIAQQGELTQPPADYTGVVAGSPDHIARPGGNEDPFVRAKQLSMAAMLTAFNEKEAAGEAEEEGDSTLLNSDGAADEEQNGG